jgi:acetyl-CoA C-acetyltransferase
MGGFQGDFTSLSAHDLGGAAIKAAIERSGIPPEKFDEVLFGNCLMAGQGQAPARQAGFKGGLPASVGAVTLSKMCGSGMEATMLAHDQLVAGSRDVMVSGGMESMTNAPHLLLKGRSGIRIGHDRIYDHMMLDGLEDAYEPGRAMGTFGEQCADKYNSRAKRRTPSPPPACSRAKAATESGAFKAEITPVTVKGRAGETVISIDEGPGKVKLDKIPTLKPAFKKDGTITAASSSSINDGAAALVLARESTAKEWAPSPSPASSATPPSAQEPELVHHRTGGCRQQAAQEDRLERERRRPLGSQRSLRRGAHGRDERARHQPRHRQRQRRRLRARPPDRRVRRPHHRHADPCAAGARPQEGHRHLVHWRRRGTAMAIELV